MVNNMKNNFITGVLFAVIAFGVGFFLSQMKDSLYNCTLKGNVIGIQSWECKNIVSGKIIKGFGAEEGKQQ